METDTSIVEETKNNVNDSQHYYALHINQYNYDTNYVQAYIETMIWYLNLMQRKK